LALSFTRLATRGCSPGTSGESSRVITSAAETASVLKVIEPVSIGSVPIW
jgi:hypothetical protein